MAPSTIFGDLAQYHVEVIVAIFTLIGSLLASQKPPLGQMPQTYILIGLSVATFLSIATNGWIAGGQIALFEFLPNLFTFFFIVMNCRTTRHLRMVIAVLLFVCLFVTTKGYLALASGDITSPYLLAQHDDAGSTFFRLCGLGFINDPNDLGQLMVGIMPCLFFFWRPKKNFSNTAFVLVPVGILVFAVYLTHSRGAIIALLVVMMVAVRRKIGTIPSAIIAGCLLAATLALGWTGGREISVEAGSDRMDAWSAGLEMIKQHPIFGVGYGAFTDHYILTAHNTIVVCAAELGLFGLFVWLLFVCSALWEAMTLSTPPADENATEKERVPVPVIATRAIAMPRTAFASAAHPMNGAMMGTALLSPATTPMHLDVIEREDPEAAAIAELRRMGRLMIICMAGFLTAGWFLSRAFQMTLFVYCGVVQVIYQLGVERGIAPVQLPMKKIARIAAIAGVCFLIVVYIALLGEHRMGIH